MDKPTCSVTGCEKQSATRGWCHRHYKRWQLYGNPEEPNKPRQPRPKTMCITNRCREPIFEEDYCEKHFERYLNTRDPNMGKFPIEERFWSKVEVRQNGCWRWTGFIDHNGYGKFFDGISPRMAHRVWWEHVNGQLPFEVTMDHKCHNRACVNPEHLREATQRQNNEHRKGATVRSKTGLRGVFFDERYQVYVARVTSRGVYHHIGTFKTALDADRAVKKARSEMFDFPEFNPTDWVA